MVNKNIVSLFVEDAKYTLDEGMELPFWWDLDFSKSEHFASLEEYFDELHTEWVNLWKLGRQKVKDFEGSVRDSVAEAKKVISKDPRIALVEAPDTVYAVVRKGKVVLTFDKPTDTEDYITYES